MPFQSKAQQRYCYATNAWDCSKWSKETNFKNLPNKAAPPKKKGK